MRRLVALLAALAYSGLVVLGAGAAGAVEGASLKPDTPPSRGYTVQLPSTWRFANATYPSDHATHLWFDPANALRRMIVVISGCVGCVAPHGTFEPPAGPNITHVVRLSAVEYAYTYQTPTEDDPYFANGRLILIRQHRQIQGYVDVKLWLPSDYHALATKILNSFHVSGYLHTARVATVDHAPVAASTEPSRAAPLYQARAHRVRTASSGDQSGLSAGEMEQALPAGLGYRSIVLGSKYPGSLGSAGGAPLGRASWTMAATRLGWHSVSAGVAGAATSRSALA